MARENGAVADMTEQPVKVKPTIAVTVPDELRALVAADAESSNKSEAAIVREIVAAHFNFTIPASFGQRRSKYGTAEERAQAQEEKAATLRRLAAAYNENKDAVQAMLDNLGIGEVPARVRGSKAQEPEGELVTA